MTPRWRATGHLVNGELRTVAFEVPSDWELSPDAPEFADRVCTIANLGVMAGQQTGFANCLRVERSDDCGQTWREVYRHPSHRP